MENLVSSSTAHHGSFLFAGNRSSVTPLKVGSLRDNKNSGDKSYQNYNGSDTLNNRFNPLSAIVMIGLLCFVLFIGFFFIFMWRCTTSRASRLASASNNGRVAATAGMDKTVVESFPVFSYTLVEGLQKLCKESECAICLTNFEEEMMLRLLPVCSHAFHPECVDMWLSSHTTCPACRSSLLPANETDATVTGPGVADPQMPSDQVTVVIDRNISNDELQGLVVI